jgi:hypothetical protein
MKINKSILQEKWVVFSDDEGVRFKIKPFPMSSGMLFDSDEKRLLQYTWDKFNFCVVNWEGLTDQDDKPLECNEENKKFIYDYVPEITTWISHEINKTTDNVLEKKTSKN